MCLCVFVNVGKSSSDQTGFTFSHLLSDCSTPSQHFHWIVICWATNHHHHQHKNQHSFLRLFFQISNRFLNSCLPFRGRLLNRFFISHTSTPIHCLWLSFFSFFCSIACPPFCVCLCACLTNDLFLSTSMCSADGEEVRCETQKGHVRPLAFSLLTSLPPPLQLATPPSSSFSPSLSRRIYCGHKSLLTCRQPLSSAYNQIKLIIQQFDMAQMEVDQESEPPAAQIKPELNNTDSNASDTATAISTMCNKNSVHISTVHSPMTNNNSNTSSSHSPQHVSSYADNSSPAHSPYAAKSRLSNQQQRRDNDCNGSILENTNAGHLITNGETRETIVNQNKSDSEDGLDSSKKLKYEERDDGNEEDDEDDEEDPLHGTYEVFLFLLSRCLAASQTHPALPFSIILIQPHTHTQTHTHTHQQPLTHFFLLLPFHFPLFTLGFICIPCGIRYSNRDNLIAHQNYYCAHKQTAVHSLGSSSSVKSGLALERRREKQRLNGKSTDYQRRKRESSHLCCTCLCLCLRCFDLIKCILSGSFNSTSFFTPTPCQVLAALGVCACIYVAGCLYDFRLSIRF